MHQCEFHVLQRATSTENLNPQLIIVYFYTLELTSYALLKRRIISFTEIRANSQEKAMSRAQCLHTISNLEV